MYDSMFVDSAPRAWYVTRKNHKTDNTDCGFRQYTVISTHVLSVERFDESWTEIKELLSKQKFDGILGFSQGAGFAAALSAVLVNPDLRPEFKDVHPPFKFCITVGGFKIHDKAYDHLYPLPVSGDKTHFLHVIGDNDMIVTPERSASLVENSPNGRCERHPGGHCESNRNFYDNKANKTNSCTIQCSMEALLPEIH